jgi:hypothetical protein
MNNKNPVTTIMPESPFSEGEATLHRDSDQSSRPDLSPKSQPAVVQPQPPIVQSQPAVIQSQPPVVQSQPSVVQPAQPAGGFLELHLPSQKRKLRRLGLSWSRTEPPATILMNQTWHNEYFAIRCGDHRSPAVGVPIDLATDTIIIPLSILNLPATAVIEDLDKIQRLCIVDDGSSDIKPQAYDRLRSCTSVNQPVMFQFYPVKPKVPGEVLGMIGQGITNEGAGLARRMIERIDQPHMRFWRHVRVNRTIPDFPTRMKYKVNVAFDSLHRHVIHRRSMASYLS